MIKVNKKFLIFSAVFLILFGVLIVIYPSFSPAIENRVSTIILSDKGFEPSNVTIIKGDTVTFITTTGKEFWPASDLHPTHGIYPEFDPFKPVKPGASWSFKFNKIGTWKYHDHLFSSRRGVINVIKDGRVSDEDCNDENNSACWAAMISAALEKSGLDKAFEVLSDLYSNQPGFAEACHDQVHVLGEAAYKKFSKNEELKLTSKTQYCGYGFYHGFMEALLQDKGDVQKARDFCAHAGRQLISETSDAEGACYHGIGHGAVDGGDPRAWGDPRAMIQPGIKLCESVSTGHFLYRCVTGVFNSIEILSTDPKYKISVIAQDPFWLCPGQPKDYKEACYTNMLPALLRLTDGNLSKSASIIEKIKDDSDYSIRSWVISGLFHEFVNMNLSKPDYNMKEGVKLCRSLNPKSHLPCVEGLAGGHMKYGEPAQEYVRGLAFCGADYLTLNEKDTCYQHILSRLKIWYSANKIKEICNNTREYAKYCPR